MVVVVLVVLVILVVQVVQILVLVLRLVLVLVALIVTSSFWSFFLALTTLCRSSNFNSAPHVQLGTFADDALSNATARRGSVESSVLRQLVGAFICFFFQALLEKTGPPSWQYNIFEKAFNLQLGSTLDGKWGPYGPTNSIEHLYPLFPKSEDSQAVQPSKKEDLHPWSTKSYLRMYQEPPKPSKTLFLVPKSQVFWRWKPLFFMVLGAPGR